MDNNINDIERIVLVKGKLKGYLRDLVDYDKMNLDQFTDSITESKEIFIERDNPWFDKIKQSIIHEKSEFGTYNFKYAVSISEIESSCVSHIVDTKIKRSFFQFLKTTGYYMIYEC